MDEDFGASRCRSNGLGDGFVVRTAIGSDFEGTGCGAKAWRRCGISPVAFFIGSGQIDA